ncbi:hypothetical protein ACGIF2_05655 [Cellulomonas sp. P22]|uniref:hypothetical protein n=1 Tax=Cellulomonas sp. P22 TaxID=3373189 RepID=UPI0037A0BE91
MTSQAQRPRRWRLGAVALGVALFVPGCDDRSASTESDRSLSTDPADLATVRPGAPPDVATPVPLAVSTDDDPRHLLVVTLGSSSCPHVPVSATWDEDEQVLRVTLERDVTPDEICTADSAQTTSVLRLPPDAPDAADLTVLIDDEEFVVGAS